MKKEYAEVLDGEKRYKGPAKERFLEKLSADANANHSNTAKAWEGFLECARKSGDALRAAKKVKGHRRKWTAWRRDNFNASPETALRRHFGTPSTTSQQTV